MRRTAARLFAIAVVMTLPAMSSLAAQPAPNHDNSASDAVRVLAEPTTVTASDEVRLADLRIQSGSSMKARVGRMLTGAVVGGWLGYFASQVAVSDWEQGPDAGLETNRGVWAAGGLVVGAVAGRLLTPGTRMPDDMPDMTRGRSLLTYDEIVRAGAANAYDLIRVARPEWLVPRGVQSWRETARGSAGFGQPTIVIPGDDLILVYLDNARIGGTQHLEGIALGNVAQIEFIDPAAASFRWGGGHGHGVILVTTQAGERGL
jgi:hypothetical protein